MKNNEFTECPMCGGRLEERTTLEHPVKTKEIKIRLNKKYLPLFL